MPSARPFLETGIVASPDGSEQTYMAYPGSLVRLPAGKLLAVYTSKTKPATRGMGSYSSDGGRTWDPPVTLFRGRELSNASIELDEGYGDPNLVVVNDKKVIAFCLSLKSGTQVYDRTRWWRRESGDGGLTFGAVTEMPRHRKYIVGTVHPGFR